MRKLRIRVCRQKRRQENILTPWETYGDTGDCENDFGGKFGLSRVKNTQSEKASKLPKLLSRPQSNCLIQSSCDNSIRRASVIMRTNKPFETVKVLSLIRSKKEKQSLEKPQVLQELSVKNFIIEGAWQSTKTETSTKKKQSSYILKQKFAEIRRSANFNANKENNNIRIIRYEH